MSSRTASLEDRRKFVQEKLDRIFMEKNKSSILGLDLEVNMLVSAAQSYKHESVLKPFPSTMLSDSNNDKNYSQLVNTLLSLPPVLDWRLKLKNFSADQLNIVYWLMCHRNFSLEFANVDQERLRELVKYEHDFSKPTHMFEIKYSEEKERKFEAIKNVTRDTLGTDSVTSMSFHGTRMDNLYSILHTGLLAHLNKNGVFGEGTYLSQEPSVSLHYSPSCKTWEKSLIGQRMSCMLVCETINDPKHVKIGVNDQQSSATSSSSSSETSNTANSQPNNSNNDNINSNNIGNNCSNKKKNSNNNNNNIPEKYFIVKNNDYVRIKYLLIYSERTKTKRQNKIVQFLNENRFLLLLISYSLLLLFVGLLNSRVFHKYVRLSYRKLTDYLTSSSSSSTSTYD